MKALVTGGCGFIGSHLCKTLLSRDWDVNVLDTFHTGRPQNLGDFASRCYINQGSITNWDAVRRSMKGVNVVYHLAARLDWSSRPRHPIVLVKTNTLGTACVLTQARAMGVHKVVFASSAAVYGNVIPCAESNPLMPVSVYGASKAAAESICHVFSDLGVDVVILRLFNVYGPGGKGVANIFKDSPDAVIYGDGNQTRDFVHVKDVVEAMVLAAKWDPGVYNIGTGNEVTIAGLWRSIREDDPQHKRGRLFEVFRSFADTSRVDPLWKAQRRLEEWTS